MKNMKNMKNMKMDWSLTDNYYDRLKETMEERTEMLWNENEVLRKRIVGMEETSESYQKLVKELSLRINEMKVEIDNKDIGLASLQGSVPKPPSPLTTPFSSDLNPFPTPRENVLMEFYQDIDQFIYFNHRIIEQNGLSDATVRFMIISFLDYKQESGGKKRK